MKRKNSINSLHSFLNPKWILGLIALVAIIFQFEGLIHVKVDPTGWDFLIDSRPPSDVVK